MHISSTPHVSEQEGWDTCTFYILLEQKLIWGQEEENLRHVNGLCQFHMKLDNLNFEKIVLGKMNLKQTCLNYEKKFLIVMVSNSTNINKTKQKVGKHLDVQFPNPSSRHLTSWFWLNLGDFYPPRYRWGDIVIASIRHTFLFTR